MLNVFLADGSSVSYALPGDFIGDDFTAVDDGPVSVVTAAFGPPPPPPTIAAPGSLTATALTATAVGAVSVSDTDDAALLRAVITDVTGTLTASSSDTGQVIGDDTGAITLTGSLAVLNAELATLEYTGASLGTDPNAAPASDTLDETVIDNRGQTMTVSTAVTIGQVPYTAPTLTVPSTEAYVPGMLTDLAGIDLHDPFNATVGGLETLEIMAPSGVELGAIGSGGTIIGAGSSTIEVIGTPQVIDGYSDDALWIIVPVGLGLIALALLLNGNQAGTTTGSPTGTPTNGTPPSSSATGSGTGHVNLVTFDGGDYSFNPEGEFVLAKSTLAGDSFEVQARYAPWDNSTSGSTTIAIAAMVGTDRVTFQVDRAPLLMVNGQATALNFVGGVLQLPGGGGTVTELSASSYQVTWSTGERMMVTENSESTGPYLDTSVSLAPGAAPGSVDGLLGTDSGSANDFTLPDGTVLQQPLTTDQLYQDFGAAYRVPAGTQGLFDYPAGETTDNFTDLNFPFDSVSLANFPNDQVQQAESLATAAGLTNPALIQDAALNYLVTGDPSFITSAANEANLGIAPTIDQVTPGTLMAPLIGVTATASELLASTGTTAVTFNLYLTGTATSDISVTYAVIAPTAAELGAAAFGGTLPSGMIGIAAGQSRATLTIDVPTGALGTLASGVIDIQLSDPTGPEGVGIVAPTAQTTIVNPVQEAGTAPVPAIALGFADGATLTQTGAGLVLDFGTVYQGDDVQAALSIANDAAAPADELAGGVTLDGAGFTLSQTSLPMIEAGALSDALSVIVDSRVMGSHTATLTLGLEALNLTGYAAALTPQTIIVEDTVGPPCYCPGTMIATPAGSVPVERLAIGDAVLAASGTARDIVWIGRRSYDQRFLNRNDEVWPVLFRAGALADQVPDRDLLVSPQHAMFIDGVLIPAVLLINGSSIRRADPTDRVDYIHVELASHDILLANGAPAESFVDDDSRGMFHNAGEHAARYPDAARVPVRYCAPRVEHGAPLEAIRARLDARARGEVQQVAAPLPLTRSPGIPAGTGVPCRGRVDEATRVAVRGWVMDPGRPDTPLMIEVLDNGRPIARALANGDRPDVRRAGIGPGRHGFDVMLPGGLSPLERHVIDIVPEHDGTPLAGSPIVIEAAGRFDADLEQVVGRAVTALDSDAGRARALAFMLGEVERLRQRQADADAGRLRRATAGRRLRRGEAAASVRPRALVIDACLPDRADAGGRRRLAQLAAWGRLGYDVSIAAVDTQAAGVDALAQGGITVCAAPVYAGIEDVLRRQSDCFEVVCLHGVEIATRYLALARRDQSRARILFDMGELLHRRLAAQAEAEPDTARRPALRAASRQAQTLEWLAAYGADAVLVPTAADVAVLRAAIPGAHAVHLPWSVMPREAAPFTARHGVAFAGDLTHAPDLAAASWLLETVMPLVHRIDPSIGCRLAVSGAPAGIRVQGVTLADPASFDRARVTVAPLRTGCGVKGEILESLAAGIPCVMTPVAAAGLDAAGLLRGVVAADAETMARHICRLHADAAANRRAAAAGRRFVRDAASADALDAALRRAISRSRATARDAA